MNRVLWCITGAGSFLRQILETFTAIREEFPGTEVGIALSRAGEEVARIYGVLGRLERVATGGRYGGIYREVVSGGIVEGGIPLSGRVSLGRYSVVAIAPASSNTVAKIAHGIADTLPTIAASQALKSGVPVVVFPSDYDVESVTHMPCYVDYDKCIRCLRCVEACPYGAIYVADPGGFPRIDYGKCMGCEECARPCPVGAITCWEEQIFRPSSIDLANLRKLEETEGIRVVKSPEELLNALRGLLGGSATTASDS